MKLGLAHRLLEHLPDEKTFFTATASQLSAMLGFSTKLLDSDLRESTLKKAREELHFTTASGIKPLYFTDQDFPERLQQCDDAPVLLYTLGHCDLNFHRSIYGAENEAYKLGVCENETDCFLCQRVMIDLY